MPDTPIRSDEISSADDAHVNDLLSKAEQPCRDAMQLHPFYGGKLAVTPKCCIRSMDDFSIWYTPGVAAPCRDIASHAERAYIHTNKKNFVAIVTDGTRVLGLGDIGPHAALPVMEGKAILFKHLGGVDAFPICLNTKDPEQIIQACKWLEPTFGGINLEDIAKPKCFEILERLRKEMSIPVWHDDQQGTAAITLAALLNALKLVGKDKSAARITLVGAGAANACLVRLLIHAGFPAENLIVADSRGILNKQRTDLDRDADKIKLQICEQTNGEGRTGGIADALRGADACVALSRPGPGVIRPEWVSQMAADSIVFACANPVPEIWPWEAKAAGARIMATGRSDFPNQVNNSLIFPGVFRGALDVEATAITDEMCLAASFALADFAERRGLDEESIIPTMDDWEVFPEVAVAVGLKAVEQGVARLPLSEAVLRDSASRVIEHARQQTECLMREGLIAPPPEAS